FFLFSSRRRHTRFSRDWSSDVCSSDLGPCDHPGWSDDFRGSLYQVRKVLKNENTPASYRCSVTHFGNSHDIFNRIIRQPTQINGCIFNLQYVGRIKRSNGITRPYGHRRQVLEHVKTSRCTYFSSKKSIVLIGCTPHIEIRIE